MPVAQESVDLVAGTKVVRAVVDPEEWAQVPDDQLRVPVGTAEVRAGMGGGPMETVWAE